MPSSAAAVPTSTSSANLTCLCGAVSLPGSYLSDSHFPVTSEICHCTDCRYSSGGLLPAFPHLQQAPPPEVFSKLTAYRRSSFCTQYFCTICGSNCFVDHPQLENDWFCFDGIIDLPTNSISSRSSPENLLSITSHAFIEGTIDGGLVPLFLNQAANNGLDSSPPPPLYANRHDDDNKPTLSPDAVISMAKASLSHPSTTTTTTTLTAKCHCAGILLSIARADYTQNPHGVHERMIPPPGEHADKYIAWFCVCRSCRLATGSSLQPWVYIPPAAICDGVTGEPVVFGLPALHADANTGPGLKGLKHYRSRNDVLRSFCSGCGATVFYTYIGEGGHGVVDVSAGILRASSGSLAREFVYWRPDGWMSHEEEAANKHVVEAVKRGWKGVGLGQ